MVFGSISGLTSAMMKRVLVYSDGGVGASEACVSMTLSSIRKVIGQLQYNKSLSNSIKCGPNSNAAPFIDSTLVEKTTAEEITSTNLSDHCSLLVMPGGRDLPYVKHLQGMGNRNISNFVRNGGSYLGICAGAYYGCSSIQFAQGDPLLEVIGPRELALFPGISQGPMFVGFDYTSNSGAMAADIQLTPAGMEMLHSCDDENMTTNKSTIPLSNCDDVTITSSIIPNGDATLLHVYYNGGCHFVHDSLTEIAFQDFPSLTTPPFISTTTTMISPNYKILATYAAPNEHFSKFISVGGTAKQGPLSAIIAGQHGRGRVVLSGVHLEASSDLLKRQYEGDPYIESLLPHIASSDAVTEKLLSACIRYLLNYSK